MLRLLAVRPTVQMPVPAAISAPRPWHEALCCAQCPSGDGRNKCQNTPLAPADVEVDDLNFRVAARKITPMKMTRRTQRQVWMRSILYRHCGNQSRIKKCGVEAEEASVRLRTRQRESSCNTQHNKFAPETPVQYTCLSSPSGGAVSDREILPSK